MFAAGGRIRGWAVKFSFGKKSEDKALSGSFETEKLKSDIILSSIETGVVVIDKQGNVQMLNPAGARITGWPSEEAAGIPFASVFHLINTKNVDYTQQEHPFHIALEKGQTVRDNQAILVPRAGPNIAVNITASPLYDADKQITGIVGMFDNVNAQRQEERQRAEFISTASHEMRTPVAAIEGYLALAMNDKVSNIDAKARGYLEKAHASTKHLGQLFQDLLTSAKAEDGRLSNHPVVVDMNEFLQKLSDDLKFAAEKKGLLTEYIVGAQQMSADTEAGSMKVVAPLYYVQIDPDRMSEVITNLFDNAVKYSDQGKISLGLTGNDQIVQLYIKDTGPGIAPTDVPHLFEKFYRVDNSSTRTVGGTGLGLFICRKIVELYSGRIWVESEVGKGSIFYINLPRLSSQQAEELKKQQLANPTLPELPQSNTL